MEPGNRKSDSFLLEICSKKQCIFAEIEAGLGCLFGRAYVAAVIWNPEIPPHKWLNDSKKVTEPRRNFLYDYIKENAIDYSVTYATETDIDKYGIYKAKLKAMHLALENLNVDPDKILVDGDYFVKY